MHIFCTSIYIKSYEFGTKLFCSVKDLKNVGYFQKSNVIEFIDFFGKTIIERIDPTIDECIKNEKYKCHAYINENNVGCIVVTDDEYPSKTAFKLTRVTLEEFTNNKIKMESLLKDLLTKYQKLQNVDHIQSLNKELDNTKQILYKNFESLMKRGEQLDDLIKKSSELSTSSKMFYIKTKKMNSCCLII